MLKAYTEINKKLFYYRNVFELFLNRYVKMTWIYLTNTFIVSIDYLQ